jgi:tetratricopeptide (TPR) repeat protein
VRIADSSFLEIGGSASTISLSQKGTYVLGRLIADSKQFSSAGVAQALSSRLTVLFGAPAAQSTAMGVRADKADDSGGISWITSDAQVYVDSGKAYIKSGDYKKAIDELKQALDYATDSELPEVRYFLGYAYSLDGNVRDALKQVADLKPSDLENDAADLVILKGKLLFDTSAFARDVQWLSSNAALVKGDSQRAPLYYLLLGLSYNGTGDQVNAKENLQKVVGISADSDLGKTASELLKQL